MKIVPDMPEKANEAVKQELVQKKQSEYHLIGRQKRVSGHILFEFDRKTKEIRPADIVQNAIVVLDPKTRKEAVKYQTKTNVKQNCFYLQALNKKNAEKKLRKIGLL